MISMDWLRISLAVLLVVVAGYLLWKRQQDKKIEEAALATDPESNGEIPVEAEVVEEEPKVE